MEIENTVKLVIAALVGGALVFPIIKANPSPEDQSKIAWIFLASAITAYIFLEAVLVILAIVAGCLFVCRVGPILTQTGLEATGQVKHQLNQGTNTPKIRAREELVHLEGTISDELLQEQREWLEKLYGE